MPGPAVKQFERSGEFSWAYSETKDLKEKTMLESDITDWRHGLAAKSICLPGLDLVPSTHDSQYYHSSRRHDASGLHRHQHPYAHTPIHT